jgi:hypothetical protein
MISLQSKPPRIDTVTTIFRRHYANIDGFARHTSPPPSPLTVSSSHAEVIASPSILRDTDISD